MTNRQYKRRHERDMERIKLLERYAAIHEVARRILETPKEPSLIDRIQELRFELMLKRAALGQAAPVTTPEMVLGDGADYTRITAELERWMRKEVQA